MRNTKRFGKVKTQEEYLILCRLEKSIKKQHINKTNKGRYTKSVPPINLVRNNNNDRS